MSKLIVPMMNGAFAFGTNDPDLKDREYMSDVVIEILSELQPHYPNLDYITHSEKGGMWNCPDRRIRDFILNEEYNLQENNLMFVGKSGGAWDCEKPIVTESIEISNYGKKYIIIVDGTYPFRGNKPLTMPKCTKVYNIYQTSDTLHGGRVQLSDGLTHLAEYDVTGPEVTHFSIIRHQQVRVCVAQSIMELIA